MLLRCLHQRGSAATVLVTGLSLLGRSTGSRQVMSLPATPMRAGAPHALRALEAAVSAVNPDVLVRGALAVTGDGERAVLQLPGSGENIAVPHGVRLLAFGKASIAMARAAERQLGPVLSRGVVIAQPSAESTTCRDLKSDVFVGSPGNLPDAAAVAAAERALQLAEGAREGEALLVLISGGGSALLPLPVAPLTLHDKLTTTRMMAAAGASITELNTVRKHLSAVKGGQLAAAAYPAHVVALVLSDVIGDPLDVIASGPTVADTSTYADALAAIRGLGLSCLPPAVIQRLEDGSSGTNGVRETPKADDPRLRNSRAYVIGNNGLAADAALRHLQQHGGYDGRIHTLTLAEPVEEAADLVAHLVRQELAACKDGNAGQGTRQSRCLILAGETTVKLGGAGGISGKGGRCSHMALLVARALRGQADWCLVSAGTDGQDGPTDAAGAWVDGGTWDHGLALGLDPAAAIAAFDSYSFFDKEGGLLRTGLTGTNVMDLHILLCHPPTA